MGRVGDLQSANDDGDKATSSSTTTLKPSACNSADPRAPNGVEGFGGGNSRGKVLNSENDKYIFLIEIQSILKKLQEKSVRQAFKEGKIIKMDQPDEILRSFDRAYEIFHPEWVAVRVDRGLQIGDIVEHLSLLLSESDQPFLLLEKNPELAVYSYGVWMHAFRKLMTSTYWLQSASEEPVRDSSDLEEICTKPKFDFKKTRFTNTARQDTSGESSDSFVPSKRKPRKMGSRKLRRQVDTIVLTDSSTDSSAAQESPDSSFARHSIRSRRHYAKEVVQPACFELDGKQSLNQFLETYERYFRNRFDGSQRECTQELSKFISGELREAYDALGGAQTKYRDMKGELLRW